MSFNIKYRRQYYKQTSETIEEWLSKGKQFPSELKNKLKTIKKEHDSIVKPNTNQRTKIKLLDGYKLPDFRGSIIVYNNGRSYTCKVGIDKAQNEHNISTNSIINSIKPLLVSIIRSFHSSLKIRVSYFLKCISGDLYIFNVHREIKSGMPYIRTFMKNTLDESLFQFSNNSIDDFIDVIREIHLNNFSYDGQFRVYIQNRIKYNSLSYSRDVIKEGKTYRVLHGDGILFPWCVIRYYGDTIIRYCNSNYLYGPVPINERVTKFPGWTNDIKYSYYGGLILYEEVLDEISSKYFINGFTQSITVQH